METKKFKIENAHSKIEWIGRKVTGSHNGTIDIIDGTLDFEDGRLSGGLFTMDTTSIKILDVADAATNAQFAGHLASEDFFSSEKFPTATYTITAVTPNAGSQYHIEGDLTIRGITHPVAFDASVSSNGDTLTASGKIVLDRTKYDMKFRSGNFFKDLGDNLIYNDVNLNVRITAKAA